MNLIIFQISIYYYYLLPLNFDLKNYPSFLSNPFFSLVFILLDLNVLILLLIGLLVRLLGLLLILEALHNKLVFVLLVLLSNRSNVKEERRHLLVQQLEHSRLLGGQLLALLAHRVLVDEADLSPADLRRHQQLVAEVLLHGELELGGQGPGGDLDVLRRHKARACVVVLAVLAEEAEDLLAGEVGEAEAAGAGQVVGEVGEAGLHLGLLVAPESELHQLVSAEEEAACVHFLADLLEEDVAHALDAERDDEVVLVSAVADVVYELFLADIALLLGLGENDGTCSPGLDHLFIFFIWFLLYVCVCVWVSGWCNYE